MIISKWASKEVKQVRTTFGSPKVSHFVATLSFVVFVTDSHLSSRSGQIADVSSVVGTDLSVFVSLRVQNRILGYNPTTSPTNFVPLTNIAWQGTPNGIKLIVGNIYLVQIQSSDEWNLLVSLFATATSAGEVTIRWAVLSVRTKNKLCFSSLVFFFFFFFLLVFFFFFFFWLVFSIFFFLLSVYFPLFFCLLYANLL